MLEPPIKIVGQNVPNGMIELIWNFLVSFGLVSLWKGQQPYCRLQTQVVGRGTKKGVTVREPATGASELRLQAQPGGNETCFDVGLRPPPGMSVHQFWNAYVQAQNKVKVALPPPVKSPISEQELRRLLDLGDDTCAAFDLLKDMPQVELEEGRVSIRIDTRSLAGAINLDAFVETMIGFKFLRPIGQTPHTKWEEGEVLELCVTRYLDAHGRYQKVLAERAEEQERRDNPLIKGLRVQLEKRVAARDALDTVISRTSGQIESNKAEFNKLKAEIAEREKQLEDLRRQAGERERMDANLQSERSSQLSQAAEHKREIVTLEGKLNNAVEALWEMEAYLKKLPPELNREDVLNYLMKQGV